MKWLILLITIFLLTTASAIVYVPIVPIINDNENYNELTGCKPPITFAQDNNCQLEKDGKYSVNTYTCGNFKFDSDCNGQVYNLEEINPIFASNTFVDTLAIATFIIFIFLIIILSIPIRGGYTGEL